ncbi:MAG: S41 family peptidase [Mariprofundaceae bacterium]
MSLKTTRFILTAGTAALLIAAVVAWNPAVGYQQAAAATDYKQLDKFAQIMDAVRKSYVKEVSDEELIEGALSGMLSSLDPHSNYLNKDMFKQMQVDTRGKFGGLGIEIVAADGGIKVVTPIEDTPADRAGIQPGDLIIKIEGVLTKGMSLMEGVKLMRGKPGSPINLTIFREGTRMPIEVRIVRAVIQVKSVKSDVLAPGFIYLRITQFQERTSEQVEKQLAELQKRVNGNLAGAVLDLRNNPGGLLNQAVEVSDLFLDQGGIVSTKSRVGQNMSFDAEKGDLLKGLPLIVLINNGSASASEIVAGALQDNQRAVLMGTKSFGKGSVQRIIPLQDGTAFKMTTSLYYTPKGRSIQAKGIEPDILVESILLKAQEEEKKVNTRVSEKDLKGHLENGNKAKKKDKKITVLDKGKASEAMVKRLSKDVQLQRALDLLKGLNALQRKS